MHQQYRLIYGLSTRKLWIELTVTVIYLDMYTYKTYIYVTIKHWYIDHPITVDIVDIDSTRTIRNLTFIAGLGYYNDKVTLRLQTVWWWRTGGTTSWVHHFFPTPPTTVTSLYLFEDKCQFWINVWFIDSFWSGGCFAQSGSWELLVPFSGICWRCLVIFPTGNPQILRHIYIYLHVYIYIIIITTIIIVTIIYIYIVVVCFLGGSWNKFAAIRSIRLPCSAYTVYAEMRSSHTNEACLAKRATVD